MVEHSSINRYAALSSAVILVIALASYRYSLGKELHYKEQHTDNFNPHIPDLPLSIDTASPFVNVSDDLLSAERVNVKLPYPPHPARFLDRPQVLSTHCVSSGSHYWEVEAEGNWELAVAFETIDRRGNPQSSFGKNKESWSLMHQDSKLVTYQDGQKTELSKSLRYTRVAVAVDIQEGTVIFYEVGMKLKQLHMFTPELWKPVCLGLGLYHSAKVTIRKAYEVHRV
ncbi:hypothetical protein ACEWY4_006368 [Coilia grayii]|uniref:B30.2/SPRY domain-containing protein n=1 Tax=Coilia grayii TaxID=363190 RepID=A0ABD1KDM2_9TELE